MSADDRSLPGLFFYLQQGFTYVTSPLVGTFAVRMRRVGATAVFIGTATAIGHAASAAWFAPTSA